MPLYEYKCIACHKHTEKIQKFSDPEITTCPHCGGELKRVLSAPAISFKGGGWYADGYGNAKPAASGDSKGTDDAKPGTAAASSSESKPAGVSESSGTPVAAPTPAAPSTSSSSDKK